MWLFSFHDSRLRGYMLRCRKVMAEPGMPGPKRSEMRLADLLDQIVA